MTAPRRHGRWPGLLAGAVLAAGAGVAPAQTLQSLQRPGAPLLLAAKGSFFVGGERRLATPNQVGLFGGREPGHVTVGQMYVEYMLPQRRAPTAPLVLLHGCCLSGKSWSTTPDGRPGWDEYFVRHGFAVYVADQVHRGRSGFDPSTSNDVRAGLRPPDALTRIDTLNEETSIWRAFRVGPAYGRAYPDSQFPVESIHEFAKQVIPDLYDGTQRPNPNLDRLSELATGLGGAVLVGHSMGAGFVLEAAAATPGAFAGVVAIEGGCPFNREPFSDAEILNLARLPILLVYGDHLDADTGLDFSWQPGFEECRAFVRRVNDAHGHATMLHLPARGIRGNSHMLMLDRNSLEIAALIEQWLRRNVRRPAPR